MTILRVAAFVLLLILCGAHVRWDWPTLSILSSAAIFLAIRYSGGTLVATQFSRTSIGNIITGIITNLVAAGWTNAGIAGFVNLTFTGVPANGETITIDGTVFTAKTTPVDPNDFQIGVDAASTAANLDTIISANHPTFDATATGAVVKIFYRTTGSAGNDKTVTENLSNATLNSGTTHGGGGLLTSAKTPQGLQCKLLVNDDGYATSRAYVYIKSVEDDVTSAACDLVVGGGSLEIVACRYQFFIYLLADVGSVATIAEGGVPFIRNAHVAPRVASVSDSGGLYLVTTDVAHGLTGTTDVFISGAEGVSNLNGFWTVTVTGPTTYTLGGSSYQAGYVANSARSAGAGQISRCFWSALGGNETFRHTIGTGFAMGRNACLNQWFRNDLHLDGMGVTIPRSRDNQGSLQIDNWGNYADLVEARINWKPTGSGGIRFTIAELWNAFLVEKQVPADTEKLGFDGYNWVQISGDANNSQLSLWIARLPA